MSIKRHARLLSIISKHIISSKKAPTNTKKQPGSDRDKSQCTLQICFQPTGSHLKLVIIFGGMGKHISDDKVQTWHPDVDLYFQEKAWVDTKFPCDWAKKTLKQTIPDNLKFVLFCDNLPAQWRDKFKEDVSNINSMVWYGLPSATDLWQPVDSGYSQLLKVLMIQQHNRWLNDDNNAERWYGNKKPYSAIEYRILISYLAGEAYKKLCSNDYHTFRLKFGKKLVVL